MKVAAKFCPDALPEIEAQLSPTRR
jgi:hypothetical protein